MNNKENFINLRAIQQKATSGEDVASPRFAKKKIVFESIAESQSAQQCAELLGACIQSGLLKPDTIIGNQSIRHESKQQQGPSFVELKLGKTGQTYNVSAELVAPDPRKFIRSGDLSTLTESDKITIVSGMCLFSAPATIAFLDTGSRVDLCDPGSLDTVRNKIVDIRVDERLQAYEADSIERLTQVMSTINTNGRTVELALNIPRVEYYLYVLDAFEKDLISPDIVLKWFGLVDERAKRIEGLVRKRVPSEFSGSNINPLAPVESKIRGKVESDKRGLFDNLTNALKSQSLFWKYLIEKDPPENFGDISRLSYKVAYLIATQNGSFPIAIEDPEEAPILDNLKKKLDGLSIRMLALYPHSNAIPIFQPKNGKVNNYFFPPQENQLGILREVVKLNKQK